MAQGDDELPAPPPLVDASVRAGLLEAAEEQEREPPPPSPPPVPAPVLDSGQPWVTRCEPTRSPVAGGIEVRLTGVRFQTGARVLFDGRDGEVIASDSTSIVVRVPERRPAAVVDIRVVNPDGLEHLLIEAFTYDSPPLIAALEPARAPVTGGTTCTLVGGAFQPGARLRLGAAEVACHFYEGGRLGFVTPPHPEGAVDVEVMNPDGQRADLPRGFTFDGPPTVEAIQPDHGPATGTRVVLAGHNLSRDTRVTLLPELPLGASLLGSGSLAVELPPRPAAGPVVLELRNPDGQLARCTFTYDALPPPHLDGVTPGSGLVQGGTRVTLDGANFDAAAAVFFGPLSATVLAREANRLDVATPAASGPAVVDVSVVNCDQNSSRLAGAFRYVREEQQVAEAPSRIAVSTLVPDHGPGVGGTRVKVRGIGFTPDARVLVGGERPASQRFLDDSAIEIVTHPARAAGSLEVRVIGMNGEARLADAYRYDPSPPPEIESVVPNRLNAAGGDRLTLVGRGFAAGARVFVAGKAADARVVDPTTVEVTAPAGARGMLADVEVRHPDGQRAVKPRACLYT